MSPELSPDDLLSPAEAAVILRVTVNHVRRLADEGKLACFPTPGKHRRFRRGDVEDLKAQRDARQGGRRPCH